MRILLIGCGKMGSAILDGWIKNGVVSSAMVTVVDPLYHGKMASCKSFAELPQNYSPDFVLLAVKPQNIDEIAPQLARFTKAVFISIIAGKKIEFFQKYLPKSLIVRAMPNLPAVIGKGATAAVPSREPDNYEKKNVEKFLKSLGKLVWLKDEKMIDSVTAVSGSGPAYVFLFADALVEAAKELGLAADIAKMLVYETIKGSIELAERSGDNLATLKKNVTSKGGTTEAALEVLEKGDTFKTLLKQAVNQANQRALELSK